MQIIEAILEAAKGQHWIEWVVLFTGLLYVVLAARENSWCWFWGIISCSFLAYATLYFYNLYFDFLLQIFYVLMGFFGLYQWKLGGAGQQERAIGRLSYSWHAKILVAGLLLTFVFGYFFAAYTPAAATYVDAFTTIFSIAATILVVLKVLENWLYWIFVDLIYVYLYGSRGAYLFALLLLIYTVIAIYGWWRWKKEFVRLKSAK